MESACRGLLKHFILFELRTLYGLSVAVPEIGSIPLYLVETQMDQLQSRLTQVSLCPVPKDMLAGTLSKKKKRYRMPLESPNIIAIQTKKKGKEGVSRPGS